MSEDAFDHLAPTSAADQIRLHGLDQDTDTDDESED